VTRRAATTAGQALATMLAIGVGFFAVASAVASSSATVIRVHLAGFGKPVPTTIGSGSCPQGRTVIPIELISGRWIGTSRVCVFTIEKTDLPGYGVRRIVQTVVETDSLPGGTIVSRQTQVFRFARDQRHTTASFMGRVVDGTGRYKDARGSVSGGGTDFKDKADWLITFRLHK
jgi:hypothetical protein